MVRIRAPVDHGERRVREGDVESCRPLDQNFLKLFPFRLDFGFEVRLNTTLLVEAVREENPASAVAVQIHVDPCDSGDGRLFPDIDAEKLPVSDLATHLQPFLGAKTA